MIRKILSLILSFSLILTQPIFAQGAAELNIGKYLNRMPAVKTDNFRPAHLRYVAYDMKADSFQLLLDKGESPKLQDATQELFNYFLIGLSLPNEKFWVNLRPDAPQQIIDPELEKTDMGRIMLEADLQLKKDTASWTSPQNPEGKEYWDKLYKKAGELFGSENITIPTITRPWIVPGEVIIRESEDSAYIYKANLKVMLEEDYIKSHQDTRSQGHQYNFNDQRMVELNKYSTQLIRELILPKLTQEINTAKKYAQLRQVFFSLILSRWFKDKFNQSGVTKSQSHQLPENSYRKLIDSRDLTNLTSKESWTKTTYFNEYKKSFEQGEYHLKEQITTPTGQVIRSYVSGGILPVLEAEDINSFKATVASPISDKGIIIGLAAVWIGLGISGVIIINELFDNVRVRVEILSSIDIAKVRSSAIRYILSESEIDTILFASNKSIYDVFSQIDFRSIEDFRKWLKEQTEISREVKDKIEVKLSTLEEEMRPMIRVYLDSILQELNSFKESSNSVKTDKISLTMFTQELLKDFNKRKASIKDYGELLGFIDELLAALDTAYTEEEGYLEQFKTKVPYNFKELFDNTKQGLEGLKLQVYKAVPALNGSSPLNAEEMAKEFYDAVIDTGVYKTYSASMRIYSENDIKNVLVSLLKENIFKKYPQSRGTEVETARKIVENYFLIEFNQANPKDSKISLKEAGASSAVVLAEDDFGEEFNKAKSAVQKKLNRSEFLHQDDKLKELLRAIIASIENTNDFIELVAAVRSTIKEYKEFKNDSYFVEKILKDMAEVLKPARNKLDKTPEINIDIQKIQKSSKPPKGIAEVFLDKQILGISRKMFWEKEFTDDLEALDLLVECYGASSAIVLEEEFEKVKQAFLAEFKKLNEQFLLKEKNQGIYKKIKSNKKLVETFLENLPFTALIKNKDNFTDFLIGADVMLDRAPEFYPEMKDELEQLKQKLIAIATPSKGELEKEIEAHIKQYSGGESVSIFKGPYNKRKRTMLQMWGAGLSQAPSRTKEDDERFSQLSGAWEAVDDFIHKLSSSSIIPNSPKDVDSPLMPGGIDFRKIEYLTQPMGSFQGLDLRLPLLSRAELEGIDIKQELAAMEQMINAKIEVSTDRLKRLLAAMSQKDAFSAQRETQLLPLLLRLCWLKEERGVETTPDFRTVLLIADTGLFVEQGNTKYSLN